MVIVQLSADGLRCSIAPADLAGLTRRAIVIDLAGGWRANADACSRPDGEGYHRQKRCSSYALRHRGRSAAGAVFLAT